jgi:predicted transcriptional regulator
VREYARLGFREIARKVEKNPGSISRVLPRLVEMGLLQQVRVGKVSYAYHLNTANPTVTLINEFVQKLRTVEQG